MIRVALLADLEEPVGPDALGEEAAFAFELIEALAESARDLGGLAVDLVARRGSYRDVPLISIDPDEALAPGGPLARFARQEAAYTQLVLSGMLASYPLVHCLAPLVSPLLVAASMGQRIVHGPLVPEGHPSTLIPRTLIAPTLLASATVPPPIDLSRFRPSPSPEEAFVLWSGSGGARGRALALEAASALGSPLRALDEGDPAALLQGAIALLHLSEAPSPCGAVWPLRALACGTPVIAFRGGGLDDVVDHPSLGALLPPGDAGALAAAIERCPARARAGEVRRQWVLARHGRRAVAARWREIYAALLEAFTAPAPLC
jgi:hypothetical protein